MSPYDYFSYSMLIDIGLGEKRRSISPLNYSQHHVCYIMLNACSRIMVRSILLDPSRVTVRSLLEILRALIEVCSRRKSISKRKLSPEETRASDFMVLVEGVLVDRIRDMHVLLEDGDGRGKVELGVVAGGMVTFRVLFSILSRRRCISRRRSNPEEGNAFDGVCNSDSDILLEQLLDRLWDMLLPECGRGKVEFDYCLYGRQGLIL
jgi:hypothetical protein